MFDYLITALKTSGLLKKLRTVGYLPIWIVFIIDVLLGWQTICLVDAGNNIHKQEFTKEFLYLPNKKINKLDELIAQIFP